MNSFGNSGHHLEWKRIQKNEHTSNKAFVMVKQAGSTERFFADRLFANGVKAVKLGQY